MSSTQAVNPKEATGAKKQRVWAVTPRWVVLLLGRVMSVGAFKYGAFNFRDTPIAAQTYQDAIERHLQLWFDGEDDDLETDENGVMVGSGVSHLASVIASCALLLDAQQTGKLVDDRQKTGIVRRTLDQLKQLSVDYPIGGGAKLKVPANDNGGTPARGADEGCPYITTI